MHHVYFSILQEPPAQTDPQKTIGSDHPHLLRFARESSSCIGLGLLCARARAASKDMCLHVKLSCELGKARVGKGSGLAFVCHTVAYSLRYICAPCLFWAILTLADNERDATCL